MLKRLFCKIFHRTPERVLIALLHFPRVLASFWSLRLFRHPFALARCYYMRTVPEGLCVEKRSGGRIHLSGDQDDLVTILVVIGRRDYGPIPPNGVVIDIGAHLGAFTLYSVWEGAAKVYSYEPDPALFATLVRNVRENGLAKRVEAHRAAVVGDDVTEVVFHAEGNASGHVGAARGEAGEIVVPAITLARIMHDHQIPFVDLLKLDCEGSEYGILFDSPDRIWERVGAVRLEFHQGRPGEIERQMRTRGFRLIRHVSSGDLAGMLWFEKTEVARAFRPQRRASARRSNSMPPPIFPWISPTKFDRTRHSECLVRSRASALGSPTSYLLPFGILLEKSAV